MLEWLFPKPKPGPILGTLPRTSWWCSPPRLKVPWSEYDVHHYIIGLSGSGKTGFLRTQLLQMVKGGHAFSFIDPHSDAAEDTLASLIDMGYFETPGAFKKLLFVEFSDAGDENGYYLPLNVLAGDEPKHAVSARVLEAFHRSWPSLGQGFAPSFDTMVKSGTKVLISNKLPLPNLYSFLLNKDVRRDLLRKETDPDVLSFFEDYFDRLSSRDQTDQIQSTIRRLMLLTDNPVLKFSLGMQECALDFKKIMDEGISVIYSLGGIRDREARRLLGCFLTLGYESAALSRAGTDRPRTVHHLVIDEFANFAATSEEAFQHMLSETRKYGLFLTLAHQTWAQMSKKLSGAVQNCLLRITFACGREDAELLAKQLFAVDPTLVKAPAKTPNGQDLYMEITGQWELNYNLLVSQPPRVAWVRIGNRPPVQMRTLDLPKPKLLPKELERRTSEVKAEYRRRLMKTQMEAVNFKPEEPPMVSRFEPSR